MSEARSPPKCRSGFQGWGVEGRVRTGASGQGLEKGLQPYREGGLRNKADLVGNKHGLLVEMRHEHTPASDRAYRFYYAFLMRRCYDLGSQVETGIVILSLICSPKALEKYEFRQDLKKESCTSQWETPRSGQGGVSCTIVLRIWTAPHTHVKRNIQDGSVT